MATANSYQLELLKEKQTDPKYFKSMNQETFDQMFPPVPPSTRTAPAVPRAEDILKPEAPKPVFERQPVKLYKGEDLTDIERPIPAVAPGQKLTDIKRTIPATTNIEDLGLQYILSRSRLPTGEVSQELQKEAIRKAEEIKKTPFTLGGATEPITAFIPEPETVSGFGGTMLKALAPQNIMTPYESRSLEEMNFQISQKAFDIQKKSLEESLRQAAIAKDEKAIPLIQNKILGLADSPEFTREKEALLQHVQMGGTFDNYVPVKSSFISPKEATKVAAEEAGTKALTSAVTSKGPGETIVESPVAYMGRLTAAPVSAGVGLAEAAITEKEYTQTVPERIIGGEAIMGAGYDIGKAASDAAGLSEDATSRKAAEYIGGGAGLIIDFLLPVVPGVGAAKGAVKAGLKASSVNTILPKAAKLSVATSVRKGAIRGLVEDLPFVSKVSPYLGDDVYSQAVARYGQDAGNTSTMKDILKVSAKMDEQESIVKLNPEKADKNKELIQEAMKEARVPGNAEDLIKKAYDLGFDIEQEAIHRTILGDAKTALRRSVLDGGLSPETKLRLSEGAAQLTDRDLVELLVFLQKSNNSTITDNLQGTTKASIDAIKKGLISPKTGRLNKLIEVLDEPGFDALVKQYLYQKGAENITDVLVSSKGIGAPDLIRLTRTSFVPVEKASEVIQEVLSSPVGKGLRDRMVDAINKGEKSIELSAEEGASILNIVGPETLRGRITAQNLGEALDISEVIPRTADGKLILTPKKYNELVEMVTDQVASSVPSSKTVFEVSQDISRIEVESTTPSISKKIYYNKVLTPKEVAGGTLESVVSTGIKKAVGEADPFGTVMSREFVDAIGQRWGSINENFKASYRANRASGLSAPDAWSKTIVENYIDHARLSMKEAEAIGNAADIADIKAQNWGQMFDDYIAMVYGGYESMIDAINTTGRTQFLDGMLVPPFEMRKLAFVLGGTDYLSTLKGKFLTAAVAGDFGEALVHLRNAHAVIQGRPIKTFIKSKDKLKELFGSAIQRDTNGILGGIPFETGGTFQGTRGIFEIWNYGGETAPMFAVDDHLKLLASQYLVRKQSAIVSEVYSEWSKFYPELFPTAANIQKNVEFYSEIVKAYPLSLYDEWAKGIKLKEPLKVRPFELQTLQIVPENMRPFFDSVYKKIDLFDQARMDSITNGTPLQGRPFVSIVMEDVMRGITSDPELGRAIYVALVEDSLTRLSASEQSANALSRVLRPKQKEIISKLERELQDKVNKIVDDIISDPTNASNISGLSNVDAFIKTYLSRAMTTSTTEELLKINGLAAGEVFVEHYRAAIFPVIKDLFFTPEKAALHRKLSGVSDYVTSIYPQLRAETTPLFYDTLKTAVRNASKSNITVITKGPIEQTQTIPLTFKESAAAKRSLLNRSDIENFTDTMEELRIHSTARKIEDPKVADELEKAIEQGLSVTTDIRKGAEKAKGIDRLFDVVTDVIGSPEALFSDGRIARFAKGGVLGGQILPNIRYLMTNYLTAPSIIYSTVGSKYIPSALKTAVLVDFDVNDIMKILAGTDLPMGLAPASLSDIVNKGSNITPRVVVTTPTGKVYTNYDLAQIVASNSIARSQASAELTNQVIQDIVSWSAINTKDITKPIPNLNNLQKSQYVEALKKAYLGTGGRSMNAFQELGQMTDTMFRASVLKKALADGASEQEAITLAREALFDYGNLTQFEKSFVSKAFWFWTFRRNSYRTVIKSVLTNPSRFKNTYLANGYIEGVDRENNIATKDYAELRPFIHLVDDKENKQRFGLYGPGTPMLQSTAELIDYLSYAPILLASPKSTGRDALTKVPEDLLLGYASQATPGIQTVIGLAFGVDPRREGKELGYGIDPRLMWYLTSNEEIWKTFQTFVNVEVVPPASEIPGRGTYQGRQWRIRKGDVASVRNWFAIQQVLLYAGLQRNLRDYASLGEMAIPGAGEVTPIQLGGEGENKDLINLLQASGVIVPIETPTITDQIEFNKRALAEEFRQGTYKTPER